MVAGEKNTLGLPRNWDDPFENLLKNISYGKGEHDNYRYVDTLFYAQCWSFCEENDLLWRAYSKGDGVKIRTTPMKLFNSVLDSPEYQKIRKIYEGIVPRSEKDPYMEVECYIGKVKYWTIDKIDKYLSSIGLITYLGDLAESLLIKREAFSDEKEVRLIIWYNIDELEERFEYSFNINNCFDEVVLYPS